MELVAAVNAVRLAQRVRELLKMSIGGVRYFLDSLDVLGMLRMASGQFNKFVGTRVSEI